MDDALDLLTERGNFCPNFHPRPRFHSETSCLVRGHHQDAPCSDVAARDAVRRAVARAIDRHLSLISRDLRRTDAEQEYRIENGA